MRRTKEPPPPTKHERENFQLQEVMQGMAHEDAISVALLAIYQRLGEQIELLQQTAGNSYRR